MHDDKARSFAELFARRLLREPAADTAARLGERQQTAIAHHLAAQSTIVEPNANAAPGDTQA